MKTQIIDHLQNPNELEKLYRQDKNAFKQTFETLYPTYQGQLLADFWHERLVYEHAELHIGTKKDTLFIFLASLMAGLIAKIPTIFSINEEFFYSRNIGFIIFPLLIAYFGWQNKISVLKIILTVSFMLLGLFFINLMPFANSSDTLILSCIHLVLFLWSILGFTYVGGKDKNERLGFLKYNGDLVIMTTLILLAGGLLTGITLGLFQLIGLNIANYYFQNVAVFGLAAAPIVGTYLTQRNPHLVGKISPVIAKLFSPLVAVMLVVYLISILYFEKNPYNNREFLLVFNALLIGVLALIFFSVAENNQSRNNGYQIWILLILSILTILVNGIALSAIVFRISEWGITPNRTAVLGGNVLIAINLIWVTVKLIKVVAKKEDLYTVGQTISNYLPVYVIWATVVTFVFPLVFGFR